MPTLVPRALRAISAAMAGRRLGKGRERSDGSAGHERDPHARSKRTAARRFLALTFLLGLLGLLGACGALIGEKELVVDPTGADAATPSIADVDPPDVGRLPPPPVEAGVDATTPDGGLTYKRVFLTSAEIQPMGNFGGTGAADNFCRAAAKAQSLGGDWVAWLSDSKRDAIDQTAPSVEYRMLDESLVVKEKTDLVTMGPAHPITMTETRQYLNDPKPWVWTGTLGNGRAGASCMDWTDSNVAKPGQLGSYTSAGPTAAWTDKGGPFFGTSAYGCDNVGRLYCFEK